MRRKHLSVTSALLPLLLLTMSRTSVSQNNSGKLEGVVLDGRTQTPLAGVRLQLAPVSRPVTTAADGRFSLENIAPGRYVLSAQKQGYMNLRRENLKIPGNSGVPLVVKAGDKLEWSLRLLPAPVASGKIFDDRGRPVQGIRIVPVRLVYDERGVIVPKSFAPATTNDLGEYRLTNLDAGDYLLKIEPSSSLGFRPNASLYYPVYYPGVSEAQQADTVELKSGEEVQLRNLVLRSARGATLHIEALLHTGVSPTRDFAIFARREGGLSPADSISKSSPAGKADIGPLGPGIWGLQIDTAAGNERLVGTARIEVQEEDLSIAVQLDRGIVPRGTVNIVSGGGTAQPLSGVTVRLTDPLAPRTLPLLLTSGADGSLRTTLPIGLAPGAYFAQVAGFPPDLFVSAIEAGGFDLLRASVTLRFQEDLNLNVTLGMAGRVQGMVIDAGGAPVIDAVVVLVPEHREDSHLFRSARSNETGAFEMTAAPGRYRLFAWSELEGAAYFDPAFLQKYEAQGRPVTLASGKPLAADLKVLN